ncbi:unnamed protein product [Calicophoron daubneyi]|uniref:UDP-N-acetylglucosamine--dolichyl-phosphate N-acetylglucosaminephosphotransferase n=1 Tax=Calicophoron daubneyi TaxID=300641 RepID=A0AAV2T2F2_CALDB
MSDCDVADGECFISSYRHIVEVALLVAMSSGSVFLLRRMFRSYKSDFLRAGFSGVDMGKPERPVLPEAQGVLAGTVFMAIMFLFIPVPFWNYLFGKSYLFSLWDSYSTSAPNCGRMLLFRSQFINYLAGLLSICCMIFLGFADDALNLPWRHKLVLPTVASLPLLMVYLANEGTTRIVVPIIFRTFLGNSIDIGLLYYVYMGMLAVFCTNAINIYSGINGLEVGQSLIIAISMIVFNILEMSGLLWRMHLFSLYFLLPFVAVSWALYTVNRYPASVFVGDTYCYFAGMTFAVVGILGHFSKTLLLFFLPQILNFLYSIPQLYAVIPCPRHRLPRFNPEDGLLYPSNVRFHPESLSDFGQKFLRICSRLRIIGCQQMETPKAALNPPERATGGDRSSNQNSVTSKQPEEEVVEVTNLTLINLVLRITGPMTEKRTTNVLLIIQVICSCLAFIVRYPLASIFYGTSAQ